jgi:carbon-monoxide dehydrogenase medium subunit
MKPSRFDYVAASTVTEALDLLRQHPDARLLAGGQSLVPLMNLRLAQPSVLIDINGIDGLAGMTAKPTGALELGALLRHRHIEGSAVVRTHAPLLASAMALVGYPAIRHRGTLGGIVAHADPSSEIPAALVALGAEVIAQSVAGQRRVGANDFFTGYFSTALMNDEMVIGVILPPQPTVTGHAFVEFAPRHGDYAVVGMAAHLAFDDAGLCTAARLVACGVSDRPVDLSEAAQVALGEPTLGDAAARRLATGVADMVRPTGDIHATSEDRRELAQLLAVDAIREAFNTTVQEVGR